MNLAVGGEPVFLGLALMLSSLLSSLLVFSIGCLLQDVSRLELRVHQLEMEQTIRE